MEFITAPTANMDASCSANTNQPSVTFNTARLSDRWLAERGPVQVQLIIHELARARARTRMEHGPRRGEACSAVGATLWCRAKEDSRLL